MIFTADEFIKLRDSENKDEYDRAVFEEASVETWNKVIDEHPGYARWVAHNKTVPIEILRKLCTLDEMTRYFVATKRRLPLDIFELLSNDKSPSVRGRVAANRKAPISILERLACDINEGVAQAARLNIQDRKK